VGFAFLLVFACVEQACGRTEGPPAVYCALLLLLAAIRNTRQRAHLTPTVRRTIRLQTLFRFIFQTAQRTQRPPTMIIAISCGFPSITAARIRAESVAVAILNQRVTATTFELPLATRSTWHARQLYRKEMSVPHPAAPTVDNYRSFFAETQ
jgi:hypothetical protein